MGIRIKIDKTLTFQSNFFIMRILTIGDVHGRDRWEQIVDNTRYDKIVFLGDYMDSFEFTAKECLSNLIQIIYYKKKYPKQVELLIGNHDLQYILYMTGDFERVKCSGFKSSIAFAARNVFLENQHLFNVVYQYKNYLFSHAGLSEAAWDYYFKRLYPYDADPIKDIGEFLNSLWTKRNWALYGIGYTRGGDHQVGSILWADRSETYEYPLEGLHQVVGHTCKDNFTKRIINDNTSITFIDKHPQDNFLVLDLPDEDNTD